MDGQHAVEDGLADAGGGIQDVQPPSADGQLPDGQILAVTQAGEKPADDILLPGLPSGTI
jgi:hypothetical protein